MVQTIMAGLACLRRPELCNATAGLLGACQLSGTLLSDLHVMFCIMFPAGVWIGSSQGHQRGPIGQPADN